MKKGSYHPKETRKKISKMTKLAMAKPEIREKISKKLRGRIPWNKGIKGLKNPHTEEWNKKISEAQKGKPRPYMIGRQHVLGKHWKLSEETKKKLSEAKRGEKHYRWNPNREEVMRNQRNDGEYCQWVLKVKKRDNWRCKINNKDCSGYCEVHHILSWKDYPELRYDINNGITLCQAHHPKVRAEEKRLIPFFQGLVPVSNELIWQNIIHIQKE